MRKQGRGEDVRSWHKHETFRGKLEAKTMEYSEGVGNEFNKIQETGFTFPLRRPKHGLSKFIHTKVGGLREMENSI